MINWSSFTPIPLVVMDDDNTTRNFAVDRNSTGIYMFGTWQTSMSDERLKKDISSLNNILPELEKLNPVDFKWKQKELFPATYYVEGDELPEGMSVGDIKEPAEERKKDEEKHYGLLAQEVKEVFPTLIYLSLIHI